MHNFWVRRYAGALLTASLYNISSHGATLRSIISEYLASKDSDLSAHCMLRKAEQGKKRKRSAKPILQDMLFFFFYSADSVYQL